MGYYQIFFLIREVYYGRCLRYFHSAGASFVFLFLFLHLGRAIFYGSYFYSSSLLLNGYSIYGLCLTFWTNEFLGSYSNYKFIFFSHFFFVVLQFFIFFIFIFYLLIIL